MLSCKKLTQALLNFELLKDSRVVGILTNPKFGLKPEKIVRGWCESYGAPGDPESKTFCYIPYYTPYEKNHIDTLLRDLNAKFKCRQCGDFEVRVSNFKAYGWNS